MTIDPTNDPNALRPLRLWPAVAAVIVQWFAWFVFPVLFPAVGVFGMFTGVACGLLLVVWWLFFSRAPWLDRFVVFALMLAAPLATRPFVHRSIENGLMGNMTFIIAIPLLSLALVAGAVAGRRLSRGGRWIAMLAALLLGCAAETVIRTDGITGEARMQLHWRWTPTAEDRLLAQATELPVAPTNATAKTTTPTAPPDASRAAAPASTDAARSPEAPAAAAPIATKPAEKPAAAAHADAPAKSAAAAADDTPAVWPGFRGPHRDDVVHGVQIDTDWAKSPPTEVWRRKIGPGWSSFAVRGDVIYTQEQRGDDEIVSAYSLTTGKPVWMHRDAARFYESNGGAGPRATPTLDRGRVYSMGATGILNALDANTGAVLWSRNAVKDTAVADPGWGFTASPLVVDDAVIVAMSGRLAGYDAATGNLRWLGPTGGAGYSSPHLITVDGVPQVLLLRGSRTISVAPRDGTLLWEHVWQPGVSIVQPALAGDDVLITAGDAMGGQGVRRIKLTHTASGWTTEERWTSRGLKAYFNDLVVHDGYAYGFDGNILACIDLANGERKWKGGRYGNGQMMLLPDQDLLLVLSEEGELALVKAVADRFTEVARVPAIEGKTWNHPVLVGDLLLVRNGEEMAAFRLTLVNTTTR